MHPVYVMCHTGEKSQEWVRRLTGDGFDAVNVEGGYRAWLAPLPLTLRRRRIRGGSRGKTGEN